MSRSLRLFLWFLFGVFISVNSVFAFADSVPANITYMAGSNSAGAGGAVCSQLGAQYADASPYQYAGSWYVGWCSITGNNVAQVRAAGDCSGIGGDLTGSYPSWMCTCPAGTKPSGGTCKAVDPCESRNNLVVDDGSVGPNNTKLDMNFAVKSSGDYSGTEFCNGGCKAIVTAETGSVGVVVGGRYYGTFAAKEIGASCGADIKQKQELSTPKPGPEYDCIKQGKGFGYANGIVICTNPSSGKDSATKTTITSNPDGTSTKTDVTKVINCSGDGSCVTQTTTTTTIISASGVPGTSYTNQTVEKSTGASGSGNASQGSSFCAENPQSTLCAKGSFSGSCASEPACDGDPVQCATAKAVFETNCKTLKPGAPPGGEAPVGERKINVNFNSVSFSDGGSCPADKTATIAGVTIRFPFTALCELASGVRPVVIALGWLVAGFIVFGYGKKSGSS